MKTNVSELLLLLKEDKLDYKGLKELNTYSITYLSRLTNRKVDYDILDDIINDCYMKWIKYDTYDETLSKAITYYTKMLFNEYINYTRKLSTINELSYDRMEDQELIDKILIEDVIDDNHQEESNEILEHIKEHYLMLYDYTYNNIDYKDLVDKYLLPLHTIKNTLRLQRLYVKDYFNNYETGIFEYHINTYRDINNYSNQYKVKKIKELYGNK